MGKKKNDEVNGYFYGRLIIPIISKVGNLDTVTEALSFASATHRANLEKLLEDSPEAKVEEVVEAEEVEESKTKTVKK